MTKTLKAPFNGPSEGNDFSYSTPDVLDRMLQKQDSFQGSLPSGSLKALAARDVATASDRTTINILALEDELHELMAEYNWKPWATGERYDIEAARGEFIDAWHFMLNLANILDLDSRAIEERYNQKRDKNVARQKAGYDGHTTKCPGCHRALDDVAVGCYPYDGRLGTDEVQPLIFCDRNGRAYPRNS